MSSRKAMASLLGWALVAVAAASEAHTPVTEPQRRKYQAPPQTLAPTVTSTAEPTVLRAWRLRFSGWDRGSLFLSADDGSVTFWPWIPEGQEVKAEADARAFLLQDMTGNFMIYVEGWGDVLGSVSQLSQEIHPVPVSEANVAQVLKDGAEIVLDNGRRYEVSAEDRAAAAALSGKSAGASVVAEREIVIWGLASGNGPLLDVKRIP